MRGIAKLAAALSLMGLSLVGCNGDDHAGSGSDRPPSAAERVTDKTDSPLSEATTRGSELAEPAGSSITAAKQRSSMAMAPDAGAILATVDGLVSDAMATNDFGALVKCFTSAGRKQLGEYSAIDSTKMDAIITDIRADWQTKYGQPFKLPADVLTSPAFVVSQGNTLSESMAVQNNNYGMPGNLPETNINRNAGTLSIAARDGLPDVLIAVENDGLIHGWRIVPSSSMTAQSLHDNLLNQLTAVRNDKDNWPADQNAEYRLVAEHILAAVTNKTAK